MNESCEHPISCVRVAVCVAVCVAECAAVCVVVSACEYHIETCHTCEHPISCVCASNANRQKCTFFDGYCSTVQGLLDWFEVNLGFTELANRHVTHMNECWK